MSTHDSDIETGKRLVKLRKQIRLTQTEFATALGISLRAYQSYEKGERVIPTEVLKELVWHYDASPTWIVTGKGPQRWAAGAIIDTSLFSKVLHALEADGSPLKGRNAVDFGYFAAVVYNRIKLVADPTDWSSEIRAAIAILDKIMAAQWVWTIEHTPPPPGDGDKILNDPRWVDIMEGARKRGEDIDPEIAKVNWGPGTELERKFIAGEI